MKVNVYNTETGRWTCYEVTANDIKPSRINFFEDDEKPVAFRIVKQPDKLKVKKCGWLSRCETYDYAFTQKEIQTVTTTKDVYLNHDRSKYIAECRKVTENQTEYYTL